MAVTVRMINRMIFFIVVIKKFLRPQRYIIFVTNNAVKPNNSDIIGKKKNLFHRFFLGEIYPNLRRLRPKSS